MCVLVLVDTMIGSIMTQVALVLTALGVVRERERGTIEQLMITPVRKLELMLGVCFVFRLFYVDPETTARFSHLDDRSRSLSPPRKVPVT